MEKLWRNSSKALAVEEGSSKALGDAVEEVYPNATRAKPYGSGFDSPRRHHSLRDGAWEITSPGTGRTLSESATVPVWMDSIRVVVSRLT